MSEIEFDKESIESVDDIIEIRPMQPNRRNLDLLEITAAETMATLDITRGTTSPVFHQRPTPTRRMVFI